MQVLIVVDPQNEFSPQGLRPVADHGDALAAIERRVAEARAAGHAIAWIRHHNRPNESRAFVPGSWGAEFSRALEPRFDREEERLFEKDVYGAFTGTNLEQWLRSRGVTRVLVVGFFTYGCVSTTVREAIVRGFDVAVDPDATASRALEHPILGSQSAEEVRRSALLHVADMGATIAPWPNTPSATEGSRAVRSAAAVA